MSVLIGPTLGPGGLPGYELLLVLRVAGEQVGVGVDVVGQGVIELVGQQGGRVVLAGGRQGQQAEVVVSGIEGFDDVCGTPFWADGQGAEGIAESADVACGQPGESCGESGGEALEPDGSDGSSCCCLRARQRAFGTNRST
ncbi:hypothetical protein C0Z11_12915 [Acidipropionibacterium jensenii]|uniref:hypothetical protein n=1 Tax=Acidipropionibacterium jensenii TaxID=1749 RepID=UPI000BEF0CF5|nr:hypothetical protein [Acidipropionibacterium jensenii]AZZ43052.1 hypothetical protein C0Z11_12915 [Acidipropionibacterium jensenii]